MKISEFVVNDFRFTFYKKEDIIEIEEFLYNDFKMRLIIPKKDFEELIRLYKEWKKNE